MKKAFLVMAVAASLLLSVPAFSAPLAGGWAATEDASVTEEARAVFDKAFDGFTGAVYEPVNLLATQVVAGTNYCFMCRSEKVVLNPEPGYSLVYIYADLEGNAEILGIQDIEFGAGILEEESADASESVQKDE